MLPAQRNKVDISSLSEEEQKLFKLYGKLPNRKDLLQSKLKERKYFDSGDYALSKAGKAPQGAVGTAIPNPQIIAHASTVAAQQQAGSPPAGSPPAGSASPDVPAGGIPIAGGPSTSPRQRGFSSAGLPGAPGSAGGAYSTSPTAGSSAAAGITGRPAHAQVSTFPIGGAGASGSPAGGAYGTSPTNSSSLMGGAAPPRISPTALPAGYEGSAAMGRRASASLGAGGSPPRPAGSGGAGFAGSPGSGSTGASSSGPSVGVGTPVGATLQAGFPIPGGGAYSTSPAKEGSALARSEITADDLMEE